MNLDQAQARHNRKIVLIGLPLLTVCVVSLLASISLLVQNPPREVTNYVIFEVRPVSSNQTFTISADVNLDDGMDVGEAIIVASQIFDLHKALSIPKAPSTSFGVTAHENENGIWTVEINSEYSGAFHCSRFLYSASICQRVFATIDPVEREVVYATRPTR